MIEDAVFFVLYEVFLGVTLGTRFEAVTATGGAFVDTVSISTISEVLIVVFSVVACNRSVLGSRFDTIFILMFGTTCSVVACTVAPVAPRAAQSIVIKTAATDIQHRFIRKIRISVRLEPIQFRLYCVYCDEASSAVLMQPLNPVPVILDSRQVFLFVGFIRFARNSCSEHTYWYACHTVSHLRELSSAMAGVDEFYFQMPVITRWGFGELFQV